jgi:hypothetical protein
MKQNCTGRRAQRHYSRDEKVKILRKSIGKVLSCLKKKRSIFHSEADFQHAFAWEIHEMLPFARVRLEKPVRVGQRSLHIDVWVNYKDVTLAVELKYKTRRLTVKIDNQHDSMNEHYSLKDQGAQEFGRYDFLKDIQRLEQVVDQYRDSIGYAVLLTNDSAYWQKPREEEPVDANFRLHHGRVVEGDLNWGEGAAIGARRGREQLQLQRTYQLHWSNYSSVKSSGNYRKFRSLVVKVSRFNRGR